MRFLPDYPPSPPARRQISRRIHLELHSLRLSEDDGGATLYEEDARGALDPARGALDTVRREPLRRLFVPDMGPGYVRVSSPIFK